MVKTTSAEYDATNRTLKLDEPLEGVDDRSRIRIVIETNAPPGGRPWLRLAGSVPAEAAEEWLRTIREAARPDGP